MASVSVPWGAGQWEISLPGDWTLQQVAEAAPLAAPPDWAQRLAAALARPGGLPPLGELLRRHRRGRLVLIVEDVTRHSPLPAILDPVLREAEHAGVASAALEVLFATGMHPPMSAEQAAQKLGPAAGRLRWRCHDAGDRTGHVRVGRADGVEILLDRGVVEADLRVLIAAVSPHLQAGFGGGYKMILPGCAALETIRGLHRLGLGRVPAPWVGTAPQENPMRRAIDAGGQLLERAGGTTFALQYLLDGQDRPAAVAAGAPTAGHRMLAKQCATSSSVMLHGQADVLIANAHPRDHDLWQAFKCIANTRAAARAGGVIIALARCEAGLGEMPVPRWPLSARWTRRIVRSLAPAGVASLLTRLVPRLSGDAAFFVRLALHTLHRNPLLLVSPALHEAGARFPGLEVFGRAEDAFAAAGRLLGAGPQRAIVFPAGGTTYPIFPVRPARRGAPA